MYLTDIAVRKAAPRERPYKLSDGGGLHVLVRTNGTKSWQMKYRFAGKEKLLSFGTYPMVKLAEAREKREQAKKLLLNLIDPGEQRKQAKVAAVLTANNTFGLIAEEYLANKQESDAAPSTMNKNRWLLQDLAAPLANRPITQITAAEILQLLKRIEQSGRRETARRLRGMIGSVFWYAIVTLRATGDPTTATHGALLAPKVTPRAAIVDEKALGGLMRAIDDYDGWPTVSAALKFTALTFARPGEVRGATRREIDFENAVWRVSAERTKMRRQHDIPLSPQAIRLLRDIWPLSDHAELIFPSVRSNRRPLSDMAMNAALRRMGYGKEDMTAHGFRASASTILNARGHNPDVIEAALGHLDDNEVRRVYNRARYWPEREKLMLDWANLLDEFRALR